MSEGEATEPENVEGSAKADEKTENADAAGTADENAGGVSEDTGAAPKEGESAPQEAAGGPEEAPGAPPEAAETNQQGEDGAPGEKTSKTGDAEDAESSTADAQPKQTDDTSSLQRGGSKTSKTLSDTQQRRSSSRRPSQEERRSQRLSRSGVITTLGIGRRVSGDQYGVFDKQKPKFMNTYRLESQKPFHVESVLKIMTEILDRELEGVEYEPESNMKLASRIAGEIRGRVKMLGFERYKIIAAVTIGEKRLQDIYMICKFLWDCERDMHAIWSFENTQIYAVAFVFGLYYE